jgi:hypothetical protein
MGENDAVRCQAIDIGRARLRIPVQAADPVVEIIDDQQEHVRT